MFHFVLQWPHQEPGVLLFNGFSYLLSFLPSQTCVRVRRSERKVEDLLRHDSMRVGGWSNSINGRMESGEGVTYYLKFYFILIYFNILFS